MLLVPQHCPGYQHPATGRGDEMTLPIPTCLGRDARGSPVGEQPEHCGQEAAGSTLKRKGDALLPLQEGN